MCRAAVDPDNEAGFGAKPVSNGRAPDRAAIDAGGREKIETFKLADSRRHGRLREHEGRTELRPGRRTAACDGSQHCPRAIGQRWRFDPGLLPNCVQETPGTMILFVRLPYHWYLRNDRRIAACDCRFVYDSNAPRHRELPFD